MSINLNRANFVYILNRLNYFLRVEQGELYLRSRTERNMSTQ